MRVSLLEDNQRSGQLLRGHLEKAGYVVDLSSSAAEFRELLAMTSHDAYIIDLGLPDGDGLDLIRELRSNPKRNAPILIVSARSSVSERVEGLNCRADDYLCKPFHIDELLARLQALLRRPGKLQEKHVTIGSLVLHCSTGDILCNGTRVDLRPSERQLLALMIRRSGRLVPKSLIEDTLRNADSAVTPNAIDKLISRLRKCLNRDAMDVELRTIRGGGYVLEQVSCGSSALQ